MGGWTLRNGRLINPATWEKMNCKLVSRLRPNKVQKKKNFLCRWQYSNTFFRYSLFFSFTHSSTNIWASNSIRVTCVRAKPTNFWPQFRWLIASSGCPFPSSTFWQIWAPLCSEKIPRQSSPPTVSFIWWAYYREKKTRKSFYSKTRLNKQPWHQNCLFQL